MYCYVCQGPTSPVTALYVRTSKVMCFTFIKPSGQTSTDAKISVWWEQGVRGKDFPLLFLYPAPSPTQVAPGPAERGMPWAL